MARNFNPRNREIRVMYTSHRYEVYYYMGIKLTHDGSKTKNCLLLSSEGQVGLRKCVNFYEHWNPRSNFIITNMRCEKPRALDSTLVSLEKAVQTGPNTRYWGN